MNGKILMVLVVVSLLLSVFSLVLTFRSNGTNAITNIVGQSSNVTWKKVELYDASYNYNYWITEGLIHLGTLPLWNVTLTLQWSNSTISTYDLGTTYFWIQGGGYGYAVPSPKVIRVNTYNGHIEDSNLPWMSGPTANITSITAYEIQPP